jgi:hypothetical protein
MLIKFQCVLALLISMFLSSNVFARYIQADPIGINRDYSDPVMQVRQRMGMIVVPERIPRELNHPYVYGNSNPVLNYDPFGLDINISLNRRASGGLGHVGIGVNSKITMGQRPQQGEARLKMLIGEDVKGKISIDPVAPYNLIIPTTPEQDKAAQQCINLRIAQQRDYNLYKENCAQFVQQCLNEADIKTSGTIFPEFLFRELQKFIGENN